MSDERPRETVVARLRPHPRALFWPALLFVAVAAALGFFGSTLRESWQLQLALAGAAVIVLLGCVLPLCSWLARNYTVTTRRIVLRSGILVRTRQEVLHSRNFAITVRQGILQRIAGSGDVELSGGNEQVVVLRDVPSVDLVSAALHELTERSREDMSIR
jgi:membrane protein YdbS with pleckstrin-like domain